MAFVKSSFIDCSQKAITNGERVDGFGSQFQEAICAVIYAELTNKKFIYTPFKEMEHNYSDDPNFISRKEWLTNFIGNFDINTNRGMPPEANYKAFVDNHIIQASKTIALERVKKIFRANKKAENHFCNNNFNIAVHVRRPNPHDSRVLGTDVPDEVFLDVIGALRKLFASKNPLFHIYSQGEKERFTQFYAPDIALHLDESVEDTFISMVLADVLVTSPSSLSYVAGLLSEGIVYYIPFWHRPLPHWISVDVLLQSN